MTPAPTTGTAPPSPSSREPGSGCWPAPTPYTVLEPGPEGTVIAVDDLGIVHVRWDDGSTLGLVPGQDRWEVLG
jgi:hypothetical protein